MTLCSDTSVKGASDKQRDGDAMKRSTAEHSNSELRKRDREKTRQSLIDAVGAIVREQGIEGVGINAVARVAGVDKVLIYRYFGDLDGLLSAYVTQQDYYARLDAHGVEMPASNDKNSILRIAREVLRGQLAAVRGSRELQELLRWELATRNPVTEDIARKREEQGSAITARFEQAVLNPSIDVRAIVTLLSAGINYLVLRSRTVEVFNGIALDNEEGWQRLEQALMQLVDIVGDQAFKTSSGRKRVGG